MATSYNGWVASPDPAAIGIDTNWSVLGSRPFANGGYPGGVKAGSVSVIFKYLVTRLHNEVEPMMTDPSTGQIGYGCWGYGYRANVNNPSVLSCHASGTAIDYNAPRHPNGTVAPGGGSGWTTAQAEKIRGIIADLGGVVRWLWSNDPMHFEIIGSEAQCAAVAARLGTPGKPNTSTPEKPAQPVTPAPTPTPGRPNLEGTKMILRRDEFDVDYMWTDTYGPASYGEVIPNKGDYELLYALGTIDKPHGQAERTDRATAIWQLKKIEASGGTIGQGGYIPPKA